MINIVMINKACYGANQQSLMAECCKAQPGWKEKIKFKKI